MAHKEVLRGGAMPGRRAASIPNRSAEYVVDEKRRLVTVKFARKLTLKDFERYVALLKTNPSFDPTFAEIIDLTDVEEVDLQADEFLKLADQVDPFSNDAKRAFVARNSLQNHAARVHKILRTLKKIEIFDSLEAAEHWITT